MDTGIDIQITRVNSDGQITLPDNIRQKLNLKDGGKIAFIEQDGKYTLAGPTMLAFLKMQEAMEGEAERLGLKDVDDVVKMIKEIRAARRARNEEKE